MGTMIPSITGATAPRFAPDWFILDEGSKPLIVAYEYSPYRTVSTENKGIHMEIVMAAFKAAQVDVDVEIQPVKDLVRYALFQENALAVIGENWNFSKEEQRNLVSIPFAFIEKTENDVLSFIIFNRRHQEGKSMADLFLEGFKKILKNGNYRDLFERSDTGRSIPRSYFKRLEKYLKQYVGHK